jgi:hypothetical protein
MENRIVGRPGRLLKTLGLLGLTAGAALTLQVTAEGKRSPSERAGPTNRGRRVGEGAGVFRWRAYALRLQGRFYGHTLI